MARNRFGGEKKRRPPGKICFETVGRRPHGGCGKNEYAQKSLRNSCGAVLARNKCGVEKNRPFQEKYALGPLAGYQMGVAGKMSMHRRACETHAEQFWPEADAG